MKQRNLPTHKEKLFPEFSRVAEQNLGRLADGFGGLLFTGDETSSVVRQLTGVHECLKKRKLRLGEAGREIPGRVALGLIKGAPAILGVKPVVSFRLVQREIEQLRGLRALEGKTPDRISLRTRKYQPGSQTLREKEILVFAFNMKQLGKAIDAVGDESIASQFTGIRKALASQSVDTATASFLSIWNSKPSGVLYGFPEEAVKETMGLIEAGPQSLNRSRWLNIAVSETEATHKPVQRALDRFDAATEVMGDYLRCVWGEPTDFKNVWRWLEKEPRGERMTPEITLQNNI